MSLDDPYKAFKAPAKMGNNLKPILTDLVDKLEDAQQKVEFLEEELKAAKALVKDLSEIQIPELFDGLDSEIKLDDGRKVKVASKIRANVKAENRPAAWTWLETNGHQDLLKRELTVSFNFAQKELLQKVAKDLKKADPNISLDMTTTVHHQTLEAFVREALARGEDLPLDIFGFYEHKTTKVKAK